MPEPRRGPRYGALTVGLFEKIDEAILIAVRVSPLPWYARAPQIRAEGSEGRSLIACLESWAAWSALPSTLWALALPMKVLPNTSSRRRRPASFCDRDIFFQTLANLDLSLQRRIMHEMQCLRS